MSNKLESATKEFRGLKLIPIVVRYTAGTPAIVQNPMNEQITLGDTGTGDLKLTLADASVAPLIVPSLLALGTNEAQLKDAPTVSEIDILTELDDGTGTDATDIHILIVKTVVNG